MHYGDENYGFDLAAHARHAAGKLGLEIAGFEGWKPEAPTYGPLAELIAWSEADAVLLAGCRL